MVGYMSKLMQQYTQMRNKDNYAPIQGAERTIPNINITLPFEQE